jgi:hypothetical protein
VSYYGNSNMGRKDVTVARVELGGSGELFCLEFSGGHYSRNDEGKYRAWFFRKSFGFMENRRSCEKTPQINQSIDPQFEWRGRWPTVVASEIKPIKKGPYGEADSY